MLSVSVDKDTGEVSVYCDTEGADLIRESLMVACKQGHIHLRTQSCGGHELEELTPFGNPAVFEVIINYLDEG